MARRPPVVEQIQFLLGTFRCRLPNATLAASSGLDQPSMIALASSRILALGGRWGRGADNSGVGQPREGQFSASICWSEPILPRMPLPLNVIVPETKRV